VLCQRLCIVIGAAHAELWHQQAYLPQLLIELGQRINARDEPIFSSQGSMKVAGIKSEVG
jgi:hypothetical protein